MLYFFLESYANYIIFFFFLYSTLILAYPLLRFALNSKNIVWLYVSILGCLIWHYCLEGYSIFFLNSLLFLDFSSLTLFNNIIDFNISFSLSPISFTFSFLVLIIGFCTNIYILNYFKGEADEGGFIFWINSFIISMLILILSNNFFTLFLGWELIGFTSFFLINFWQSKRSTLKSSFKAFSFNLLSDLFLLGALVIFYQLTNTTDISAFLYLISWGGLYNVDLLNFGILLLIGCASIKSVQLIGHLWLPDSMEAPVPASALIHSATLVSAGIYLLARFNILIILYNWTAYLIFLGSITAAYGGVVAASQTDMKKLLAYSTMSHCGFLMILVACSNFYILITYLFLHGFYKAATFFCAGSFIRIYGSQDTRVMGSNNKIFIGDTILLIICAGNLAGLPLTIGVLYKNFFLTLIEMYNINILVSGFIFVGLLTGILYFYRLVFYSVFDITKWTNLGVYEILEVIAVKFRVYNKVINKTHFLATSILLFFSFSIFLVITWVTLCGDIEYEVGIFNNFIPNYLFKPLVIIYTTHLIYFYFIYLILVLLLLFITWRYQITWGYKGELILISFYTILFGSTVYLYI